MSTHGTDCDNGCGCHGNAIPPTSVILARLDPDALARAIDPAIYPALRNNADGWAAAQAAAAAVRAFLLGADL